MKSFLFDANALIYWVNEGAEPHGDVSALIRKAVSEHMPVFALASSLNDVFYALQVSAIVSYDRKAFRRSAVPRVTAAEALTKTIV